MSDETGGDYAEAEEILCRKMGIHGGNCTVMAALQMSKMGFEPGFKTLLNVAVKLYIENGMTLPEIQANITEHAQKMGIECRVMIYDHGETNETPAPPYSPPGINRISKFMGDANK